MGEVSDTGALRVPCHTFRSRDMNGLKRLIAVFDVEAYGIDDRMCAVQGPFNGSIVMDIRPNRLQRVGIFPEQPSSAFGMT